jgi:hypothetical protein
MELAPSVRLFGRPNTIARDGLDESLRYERNNADIIGSADEVTNRQIMA